MTKDPQSEKYTHTLSDIRGVAKKAVNLPKNEEKGALKKAKFRFRDYPAEQIIIFLIVLAVILIVFVIR